VDTLTAYKGHLTEIAKLGSALSLLNWDQQTHMPKRGVAFRSQVTGKLAKMRFELSISDELGAFVAELEKRDGLSDLERGSLRRVGKDYRRQKAIPPALVEESTVARSNAQAAWASAREASAFGDFAPHLEKMVGYARRFAELYGYEDHPYDALLEGFEPGMTCAELREIIGPLRDQLVPFLARLIKEGTKPDATVLAGDFDVETQRAVARRALEAIGYDFAAGALDDVAHPFTTTIGPGDVRVTNRYAQDQLGPGLFAALHEGGHALYNQGMGEELFALGLAGGASNGIHESQSRMIENQVGRSLPFWDFFRPVLDEDFPQFAAVAPETLYRAANVVSPSLIRVEADEVTYNFHIMLRFEIEAGLIDGSIGVEELPRLWNEAMERYLGVTPPDDARGVLQDVHWSMGAFGYFPSYMLGNLYAAQMHAAIRERIPDLDDQIRSGDFDPLLLWLRENVHRHGAAYEPKELIERITGETLDSSHFVRYVTTKFGDIYGI
jgi:carboxypeptidase Taq